jgi:hypothetical protein
MAETLRDLMYGAALRSQPMTQPPMLLPDTIQRLAMQQGGSIGAPQRSTLAQMLGNTGTAAQRLAAALDQYGARIPGTQARITLKDLTLGDAGQVMEDWSYGSPPTTGGNYATGGIGTMGVQPRAMDLLNLGGVAGGAVQAGKTGARVLGPTLRNMVQDGGESFMRGIGAQQDLITWHGSPHTFDRFDASKIGTGEGAQAYGHGLYLAESPGVADSYKQALAGGFSVDGVPIVQRGKRLSKTGNSAIDDHLIAHSGDIDLAIAEARQYNDPELPVLLAMKARGAVQRSNEGSLYKVDLPDSMIERMLDWDKPLSAQPMAVQDAFNLSKHAPGGPSAAVRDYLGRDAYILSGRRFNNASSDSPEVAAWLRSKSIPGIRYLDGGSRADGAGTANFVIFPGEESALTILERNGRPLR